MMVVCMHVPKIKPDGKKGEYISIVYITHEGQDKLVTILRIRPRLNRRYMNGVHVCPFIALVNLA